MFTINEKRKRENDEIKEEDCAWIRFLELILKMNAINCPFIKKETIACSRKPSFSIHQLALKRNQKERANNWWIIENEVITVPMISRERQSFGGDPEGQLIKSPPNVSLFH